MSASAADISAQMVAQLRLTDPELDTSTGTTTRKILDAVSEQIAEAGVDAHLLTYQYDIDSKIEADLDDFCQLFGIARMPAKRASGTVVFLRNEEAAAKSATIPVNTQITSTTDPAVVVQTVTGAVMAVGQLSVTVPVQAVVAGTEGNLGAATLTTISSPIQGVNSVTNVQPLSGGTHQETDSELRARWKSTVFRSLAGTEQMYLGIAVDHPSCYVANVVGSSKRRREQVQIVTGAGITTVDDAAFTYAAPVIVGLNIDAGDIFVQGVDYNWDNSVNPPKVVVIDDDELPDGTVIEVDFEYQPLSSRNDPANGVTHRVDVWTGGQMAKAAIQSVIFKTGTTFNNTALHRYLRTKYERTDGVNPVNGNIFVPLAFGPIISVPGTLTIGGDIYALADATHAMGSTGSIGDDDVTYAYRVVHEKTAFGYAASSRFGLEWHAAAAPANKSVFTVGNNSSYTFNAMIAAIQDAISRWSLVGIDALVHQAKEIGLRFNLAIMYVAGSSQSVVNSAINTAIADFLTSAGFQSRIQVSDILQVVHNVPGVDNVRFMNGTDHSGYVGGTPNIYHVGIQRIVAGAVAQSYVDSTGRPKDIYFGDNELPIFDSTFVSVKAQNSFGIA